MAVMDEQAMRERERERDEMARTVRRGNGDTGGELVAFDPLAVVERLRAKRATMPDRHVVDLASERRRQRLRRLDEAGFLDAEVAALVCGDVAPVRRDHAGSLAAFRAARDLLDPAKREEFPGVRLRTVVMLGTTGTGKTVAAAWCVANSERIIGARRAHWLAAGTAENYDQWRMVEPRALSAPLLVINDLRPKPRVSDGAALRLAHVLETRHDQGLPTLITANASRFKLETDYGDAVASRLADRRRSLVAVCGGPDMRRMP